MERITFEMIKEADRKRNAALEKLTKQLAEYEMELSELEHERLTVVTGEDVDALADILRKISEIRSKIEAVQLMIDQRKDAIGYTDEDVLNVANEVVREQQKKINSLIDAYKKERESAFKAFRSLCIGITKAILERDVILKHHTQNKPSEMIPQINGLIRYNIDVNAHELANIMDLYGAKDEKFAMFMLCGGDRNRYYLDTGDVEAK